MKRARSPLTAIVTFCAVGPAGGHAGTAATLGPARWPVPPAPLLDAWMRSMPGSACSPDLSGSRASRGEQVPQSGWQPPLQAMGSELHLRAPGARVCKFLSVGCRKCAPASMSARALQPPRKGATNTQTSHPNKAHTLTCCRCCSTGRPRSARSPSDRSGRWALLFWAAAGAACLRSGLALAEVDL